MQLLCFQKDVFKRKKRAYVMTGVYFGALSAYGCIYKGFRGRIYCHDDIAAGAVRALFYNAGPKARGALLEIFCDDGGRSVRADTVSCSEQPYGWICNYTGMYIAVQASLFESSIPRACACGNIDFTA